MSKVVVLPVDIFSVEGLDVYQQMAYMVIRSYMNGNTKQAFPSYATIARMGRMCKNTAIKAVKVLTQLGLLKKETRELDTPNENKRNTSNLYTFPSPSHEQPGSPDDPPIKEKPSPSHAPKQRDYKNLLTNKMNRPSNDLPIWIKNQPKHEEPQEIKKEDSQLIDYLLKELYPCG